MTNLTNEQLAAELDRLASEAESTANANLHPSREAVNRGRVAAYRKSAALVRANTDPALDALLADNTRLREVVEASQKLIDVALPCFNWGKSALSAEAITLLNEVPGKVAAALAHKGNEHG